MAAPAPAPPPKPPRRTQLRRLLAVTALAVVCVAAGHSVAVNGVPLVDVNLSTEEMQSLSSADADVRYDPYPGISSDGHDPLPVEVLLVREWTTAGDKYRLRFGHHPEMTFHEVSVPSMPFGSPHIVGVDWGADRITVRFNGGYTVGVPSEYAVGGLR